MSNEEICFLRRKKTILEIYSKCLLRISKQEDAYFKLYDDDSRNYFGLYAQSYSDINNEISRLESVQTCKSALTM